MKIDGGCHCGRIRFEAQIDPQAVAICHCTDCQTLSGSAFRTVVPAAKDAFRMDGTPKVYVKTAESGRKRIQTFCPDCGTPLYSAADVDPQVFNIRIGSVRQRSELVPRRQVWSRSAQPWLGELAAIPCSERQELIGP